MSAPRCTCQDDRGKVNDQGRGHPCGCRLHRGNVHAVLQHTLQGSGWGAQGDRGGHAAPCRCDGVSYVPHRTAPRRVDDDPDTPTITTHDGATVRVKHHERGTRRPHLQWFHFAVPQFADGGEGSDEGVVCRVHVGAHW